MKYIGYVSMPFGKKNRVDFDHIYREAILPAPNAGGEQNNVFLFREDVKRPKLELHHEVRVKRFRGDRTSTETQLRESIQENIVVSDFVIVNLTGCNPNVMLEAGFAQAQKKIIIYLLEKDQFKKLPTNLGNLKRLLLYGDLGNLRYNLYLRIQEAITSLDERKREECETGGLIDYYVNRDAAGLSKKFAEATSRIQIITTNLTTVSANFIDSIEQAIQKNKSLSVKILTSDPETDFIAPRAMQLSEDEKGYRMELQGSLESIRSKLRKYPNTEVRTYKDFPVQLWHLIDNYIYVGQSSLLRRTRYNCVIGINVDTYGVKETYLDHFDILWDKYASSMRSKKKNRI